METTQQRHQRFLQASTNGITVLEVFDDSFEENRSKLIHKLVMHYNNKIDSGQRGRGSIDYKTLDVFYKVLCYDYQLRISSKTRSVPVGFDKYYIYEIVDAILSEKKPINDDNIIQLMVDIIVLQLVLYCDLDTVNYYYRHLLCETDKVFLYTLIGSSIDAWYLNVYIHGDVNSLDQSSLQSFGEFESMNPIPQLLRELIDWSSCSTDANKWSLVSSIFTKLMMTVKLNNFMRDLWELIMRKNKTDVDSRGIQLTLLTLTIDSLIVANKEFNFSDCNSSHFWDILCDGLTSVVEQQRKQALYIMKKFFEFIDKQKITVYEPFIPFINSQCDKQSSLQQLKNNFFLILECLDEKQAHLVTPALEHLESLINGCHEHLSCINCFDRQYLRCVFKRILQHKTNAIVKFGLMSLLRMNPEIYDGEFIKMLIEGLNHTFLYNNPNADSLPEVTRELAELFIKAENTKINLMDKFICRATITWSPISLFYVTESLRLITEKLPNIETNQWTEFVLRRAEKIMENNLKNQSPPLHKAIQFNICQIFSNFAEPSFDLTTLAHAFSGPHNNINRGSKSWMVLVNYVTKHIYEQDPAHYVWFPFKHFLHTAFDKIIIKPRAFILFLLYDAKKIFIEKSCTAKHDLRSVFDLIIGFDSRPYADTLVAYKSIELMTCLLDFLLNNESDTYQTSGNPILHLIIPYLDCTKRFFFKSLKPSACPNDYDQALKYIQSLHVIARFYNSKRENNYRSNELRIFHNASINIIDEFDDIDVNIRYWYVLQVLAISNQCCIYLFDVEKTLLYKDFLLKQSQRILRSSVKNSNYDVGKIITECYGTIAQLLHQFFACTNSALLNDFQHCLISLTNLLENGKEHVISSVIGILIIWYEKSSENIAEYSDDVKMIVDTAWRIVWDLKKGKLYWSAMEKLILLMVKSEFHQNDELKDLAIWHIDQLIVNSDNIPALRNLLLLNISRSAAADNFHFYDQLSSCILHTNVGRTDIKIEMQAYNYLIHQHGIDFIQEFILPEDGVSTVYIDVIFRAHCTLILLNKMSLDKESSTARTLVLNFLKILKKYQDKRYYGDSTMHRMKHRIMQLLLLIQPALDPLTTRELHDTISELIIMESNQPTVRIMQEWLLIKIYNDNPTMQKDIWQLLEMAKEKRPGSIVSIASIIYHVSRILPELSKNSYIEKAIENLLPCCFSQQFVVRLYCQVILSKIFVMLRLEDYLLPKHQVIERAVQESMRYGNLKKNSTKLIDDFYFTIFHPIGDYNLQTIFYDLPRVLNMSMDEWIPYEVFQTIDKYFGFNTPNITNENPSKFSSITVTSQISKAQNRDIENITEEINDLDISKDIQKKVTPWASVTPINDDSSGILTIREEKLSNDVGMIVVASLIDNMPNLGGLSRTSEIFCARELVLGSVKYTENTEFRNLSVSSEKWITIMEVKPHELRNYLLEKKSMGWTLIGAEQTTNSVSLMDMKFDKKTVLLLGILKTKEQYISHVLFFHNDVCAC